MEIFIDKRRGRRNGTKKIDLCRFSLVKYKNIKYQIRICNDIFDEIKNVIGTLLLHPMIFLILN